MQALSLLAQNRLSYRHRTHQGRLQDARPFTPLDDEGP